MRNLSIFFISIAFVLKLYAAPPLSEQEVVSRVSHHLVLENFTSAYKEIDKGIALFPHSKSIQKMQIELFAKSIEEEEMLRAFEAYILLFPDELNNQELLELVSWGVLSHAGDSPLLPIQVAAMLGAVYTQDVRAVDIVYMGLNHTSAHVRSAAVQLVPYMRDQKLVETLITLYTNEDFWPLRLQIIDVLGENESGSNQVST